jgi:hypothetical protein
MKATDIAELADMLRQVRKEIDDGDLVASSATTYRLEGAVIALDTVSGKPADSTLIELLFDVSKRGSDTN